MNFNPETAAPRRLLMTADTVGGVWTYALDLCRGLSGAGVEILLATMGAPLRPDQWAEVQALPRVRVEESAFRLEWMENPWDDLEKAGEWLLSLEAGFAPDVIHINSYSHAALPWRAPVLVAGHSCVLSWWRAVKGEPAPASWNRYAEAVRAGLQAADLVVAPTRAMLETLREHYSPLPESRVIYNGRDPVQFDNALPKEPFVLSAGRLWDEAKNISTLARAAAGLAWPVVVAGEPAEPGNGAAVSFPNVQSIGHQNHREMKRLFARASIYALPACYEPFGLSVLEAALSGCALVLGDIPSLREIWGDAAVYVSPRDHQALHDALRQLIDDSLLRRSLAVKSSQRAQHFTVPRMTSGCLYAYSGLLRRAAPAALCPS